MINKLYEASALWESEHKYDRVATDMRFSRGIYTTDNVVKGTDDGRITKFYPCDADKGGTLTGN